MQSPTTPRDQLRADLDRRHDEFVELCAQLLRRPSENPPGDTTAVTAFVADYLHGHGIAHEVIAAPEQPTLPNIVASFAGEAGAGPHLVLNGHLDVFPPAIARAGASTRSAASRATASCTGAARST